MSRLPLVLALAVAGGAPAAAESGLADPTRPPNVETSTAGEVPPAGTQLQSILIAPGRRIAVINGQAVALGGALGDAKVIRITETEVTLQRGEETEILRLLPAIEKRMVRAPGGRRGTR
jgi:hypothetical protein